MFFIYNLFTGARDAPKRCAATNLSEALALEPLDMEPLTMEKAPVCSIGLSLERLYLAQPAYQLAGPG